MFDRLSVDMFYILVLCPVLLGAGVQTLTIDSQLGTSIEDCFERVSIGEQLPPDAIYRNVTELITRECEQICKQDKQCQSYDYGVGAKGNATCNLSNLDEKQLNEKKMPLKHPDYDVYVRRIGCEQSPPTPIQPQLDELNDGLVHRPVFRPVDQEPDYLVSGDLGSYQRPHKPFRDERPDGYSVPKPDYDVGPSYGNHRPQDIPYKPHKPDLYDELQLQDPYKPPNRPAYNDRPSYIPEKPEYHYITRPNRKPRPQADSGYDKPNNYPTRPGPYQDIGYPASPIGPPSKPNKPHSRPGYNGQYASGYGQSQYEDNSVHVEINDPPRPIKPSRPNYDYGIFGYGTYSSQNSYSQAQSHYYGSTQLNDYGQSTSSGYVSHKPGYGSSNDEYSVKPHKPGYGGGSDDNYSVKPQRPLYNVNNDGYGHKPLKPAYTSNDEGYAQKPSYSSDGSEYGSSSQKPNYDLADSGYGSKPQQPTYLESDDIGYGSNVAKPGYGLDENYGSQSQKPSYGTNSDGYGTKPQAPSYGSQSSYNYDDYKPVSQKPIYGSSLDSGYGTRPPKPSYSGSAESDYGTRPQKPNYESPDETGYGVKPYKPSYGGLNDAGYGQRPQNPSYGALDETGYASKPLTPSYGSSDDTGYGLKPQKPSYEDPAEGGYGHRPQKPSYGESDNPGYGTKPQKPSYAGAPNYEDSGSYGSKPQTPSGNRPYGSTQGSSQASYGQSSYESNQASYAQTSSSNVNYGSHYYTGRPQDDSGFNKPSHNQGSYGQGVYGSGNNQGGNGVGSYGSSSHYGGNKPAYSSDDTAYGSSQGSYGSSHGTYNTQASYEYTKPAYGNNRPYQDTKPQRPAYGEQTGQSQRPNYDSERPDFVEPGYGGDNPADVGYGNEKPNRTGYQDVKPVYEFETGKPNAPSYIARPGGEVITSRPMAIGDYSDTGYGRHPARDASYKACFRRVLAGRRALRSHVRKVVPCETLEDCRRECAIEKRFPCESFNYKLDPVFRGKGLCELMTKPIEAFDLRRDFVEDKDFDFYELDRNSLEPNCLDTLRGSGILHSGFLSSKPNRVEQSTGWRDRFDGIDTRYRDRYYEDRRGTLGNRRYDDRFFVPYQVNQGLARSDDEQESWGQYGGIYGGSHNYYKDRNDYHKSISHWQLASDLEKPSYGVKQHDNSNFDYNSLHSLNKAGWTSSRYGYGSWKRGRWNSAGSANNLDFHSGFKPHKPPYYEPSERSDEGSGKDCSSRRRPGMSLGSGAIRRSLIARSVVECEAACFSEREFKCVSYSYRYSHSHGTDNCYLSERPYRGLELSADSSSDVYAMPQDQGCVTINYKPWVESECFWHVRSGAAVSDSAARAALTVAGLGACEAECIRAHAFFCRGFSFRFDSPTIGDDLENCILTSSPPTSLENKHGLRPNSGHELYARGNYGRGCEPALYDDAQHRDEECYLQYDKAAKLTGSAIRGQAHVKDEQSCAQACTEAPFRCLSFSYNNNAPHDVDNCLLSEIRLFDLQKGVDYVHSADDWLFAFDLFNGQCWRKVHQHSDYDEPSQEIPRPLHGLSNEDHYAASGPPSAPTGPGYLPERPEEYIPASPPSGPSYPSGPSSQFKPEYPPPSGPEHQPSYSPSHRPSYPAPPSGPTFKPGYPPHTYPEPSGPDFNAPEYPSGPSGPDYKPGHVPEPISRPGYPGGYPANPPDYRPGYPASDYRPGLPEPGFKPDYPAGPHLKPDYPSGSSRPDYRPEYSRPQRPIYTDNFRPSDDVGAQRPVHRPASRPYPGSVPGGPGYLADNSPARPGGRPGFPDREVGGPISVSWKHYTVSGFPCRAGTTCAQNHVAGHWACEPEGGEVGSWDYCCAPSHRCGYSEGFHKPWCYVGPTEDQWRPCSEKYYPYHQHKVPHPSSQGQTGNSAPRPWRDRPEYDREKPQGPYLSDDDRRYWDDLYKNGPQAYYDKFGNPLPGYTRVPTADRPQIKYKHNYPRPGSGQWLPVNQGQDESHVPGGLGAPRYWPVAYLHKGPPPNMTYFRYNETQFLTTTEESPQSTQHPITLQPKTIDFTERSHRDEKMRNISDYEDVTEITTTLKSVTTTTLKTTSTTEMPEVTEEPIVENNTKLEFTKVEKVPIDKIDGIDGKLVDFDSSIEILDLDDVKGDKVADLKTLEAEERQIEEIGRILASRRGGKLVLDKRSQKELESKNIAVDQDLIDFNFGNRFNIERRGVIQKVSKDEIERDRGDKSLEVSETTFVRPPRVLSTTENIRKAIVNGKVFYDATIREQRDIFVTNSTRKSKSLRSADDKLPSLVASSNYGKKIVKARNVNPVRRVRRVYKKRYNPEEVRRRLLERERLKQGNNTESFRKI